MDSVGVGGDEDREADGADFEAGGVFESAAHEAGEGAAHFHVMSRTVNGEYLFGPTEKEGGF